MKLPEGMPEELKELLRGLNPENARCPQGICDCQQVAKLKGDELLLLKTCIAKADEHRRACDLLQHGIELHKTENKKMWAEFWEAVYKAYGLMSDPEYHWTHDGRIMLTKRED